MSSIPRGRIFVAIPSYRDTECQHTIADLLAKAEEPERVSFGVCFQYDKGADVACFTHWPKETVPNQIRVLHVPHVEARGPCYARHLAHSLFDNEEYLLSIDSHMRACPKWDALLIAMLADCPSERAILSTYPPDYTLPNNLSTDPRPIVTCAREFGPDGILRITGRRMRAPFSKPRQSLLWVAGFSFSRSSVLAEVPYDPHLPHLFFGEEISMTIRLFSHGWRFYAPGRNVLYHLWERTHRPSFRENEANRSHEELSRLRIKYMLGMVDEAPPEALVEVEKYGVLNRKESIEEYQKLSGLDFKEQKVSEFARRGAVLDEELADDAVQSVLDLLNALSAK